MTRPEPARLPSVPDVDYRGSTAYLDWLKLTETDFQQAEPAPQNNRLSSQVATAQQKTT